MGKLVDITHKTKHKARSIEEGVASHRLRDIKNMVLNESNRIDKEHGHFRASLSGMPKLAYGQGHDMTQHGEGKPYNPKNAAMKKTKEDQDKVEKLLSGIFDKDDE